jgi:hypothetical protein
MQLIKLLVKHSDIKIKYLCGNSSVGKTISSYEKLLSSKKISYADIEKELFRRNNVRRKYILDICNSQEIFLGP